MWVGGGRHATRDAELQGYAGARRYRGAVRTRTDRVSHRVVRKGRRGWLPIPTRTRTFQSSCRGTQRGRDAQPSPPGRLCVVGYGGGFYAPPAGSHGCLPVFIHGNPPPPIVSFPENAVLFAVVVAHRHVTFRRLVQAPDRMIFHGGCAPAQTEVRRRACGAVFEERPRTLMAHQRVEP